MKIADEWDEEGRPKHYTQLDETAFTNAAVNLSNAFSTFLTSLNKNIGSNSFMIKNTIANLTDKEGGLSALMTAVKDSVTPLATFSSGRISVNGKIFKTDYDTL